MAGKCCECVRIHRHFGDHVPNCLQPMLRDKVAAIARAAEMTAAPKPTTPGEYWDYVNEVAPSGSVSESGSESNE
ncbi:MAG: hypothetical protein ACM3ZC_07510 [Bacteroidota bacterium]